MDGKSNAEHDSLGAKSLTSVTWSYLAIVSKTLMTLAVLAVLARLLTPHEFGLVGITWIVADLARRLGETSIGHALVQQRELQKRHLDLALTLSLAIGIVTAAATWLMAPSLGSLFKAPALPQYLQLSCLAFVVASFNVVPSHWLRREFRFKQLRLADLLAYAVGYGALATSLAFLGFGAWALVAGELARVLTHTAVVAMLAPTGRLRFAFREAGELVSRSTGYMLLQGLDFTIRNAPYVAVGRWLGFASLGHYNRAERLASLLPQYVEQGVFEVAFAAVSRRQQQPEHLGLVYAHSMEAFALASTPISAFLFVAAPELVAIVFGSQWAATVPVLEILALCIPLQVCTSLSSATLRGLGALSRETAYLGVHALLLLPVAWFCTRWGVSGVAIAVLVAQAAACLLMVRSASALVDLPARQLLRSFLPALWLCTWTTPATWWVATALRGADVHVALTLSSIAVVWATTAIGALLWAPSVCYPKFMRWALQQVPFEALGTGGRYLKYALARLSRQ